MVKVGIIGGSGLDDPDILKDAKEITADTPYGKPTSILTCGSIKGVDVVIIARHGKDHSIFPSAVNFRANIQALKDQGCTHILAATAVGSLRQEIAPGHLVFPGQFIDHTRKREVTFFDKGEVVHTSMAEPFCPNLIELLSSSAGDAGIPFHKNKTVITIEGPRFSTKAESHMFRSWNADIINMSTVPEVCLARERKIHYAAVAMSTDYDCWHEEEEPVTWEMIVKTMKENAGNVIRLLLDVIPKIKEYDDICNS
ncbi:MAG TPA: S-methyl-5'-thioadenosine phosphorylase [Nitrospirae bacterium]|nr:S-methyl-5'-thioadenosine phosphorylase [Nitrospirota bacterium]HDN95297.1 S-methyl-5'-thioadenosine phosphorylase [Nitrospirota bacterium]HDO67687.1 S-methyl-5'-thioadenosine phosphorylase [Nitrospirota bacterium]HEW81861.1 S-methyl-5'-thioadenosine phosphorylase [Nitrospirota bacterium]